MCNKEGRVRCCLQALGGIGWWCSMENDFEFSTCLRFFLKQNVRKKQMVRSVSHRRASSLLAFRDFVLRGWEGGGGGRLQAWRTPGVSTRAFLLLLKKLIQFCWTRCGVFLKNHITQISNLMHGGQMQINARGGWGGSLGQAGPQDCRLPGKGLVCTQGPDE